MKLFRLHIFPIASLISWGCLFGTLLLLLWGNFQILCAAPVLCDAHWWDYLNWEYLGNPAHWKWDYVSIWDNPMDCRIHLEDADNRYNRITPLSNYYTDFYLFYANADLTSETLRNAEDYISPRGYDTDWYDTGDGYQCKKWQGMVLKWPPKHTWNAGVKFFLVAACLFAWCYYWGYIFDPYAPPEVSWKEVFEYYGLEWNPPPDPYIPPPASLEADRKVWQSLTGHQPEWFYELNWKV